MDGGRVEVGGARWGYFAVVVVLLELGRRWVVVVVFAPTWVLLVGRVEGSVVDVRESFVVEPFVVGGVPGKIAELARRKVQNIE